VFDDDLPNLLGINPVEATFILGVLYYFFGSETIYEYAREAGRLFTTYVPIVKDLTFDISREFRDYFEENRERELMRKAGVDVDKVPRRTSNVIERFQEGLKAQQETDAAAQEVSVTSSSCPDPLPQSSCCHPHSGGRSHPGKDALSAGRCPRACCRGPDGPGRRPRGRGGPAAAPVQEGGAGGGASDAGSRH
jgi:hypothetical protein